jgi:hypothetical protein
MVLFMLYRSGLPVWTSVLTSLAAVVLLVVASPFGLGLPQDAPKSKSSVGGLIGQQRPAEPSSAPQSTKNMSNLPESDSELNLPDKVGRWNRDDEPLVVTDKSIFDYMDGAGELYLGYRFCRLDVYTYKSKDEDEIVAELYWMKSSDDAFGLLSQDWGGEPQGLASHNLEKQPLPVDKFPQAVYGAGLLRIWSNNLYARVMTTQENALSRDVVMAIGRAIVAGRTSSSPPKLLGVLPAGVKGLWTQRSDRLCFLRSHLVMNSVYFLSTENLLDLGPQVEAVSTVFDLASDKDPRPAVRLLLVRYSGPEEAQKALVHFMNIYLPEKAKTPAPGVPKSSDYFRIEDGWLGYQKSGRHLILVFECPDRETATSFIDACTNNLHIAEVSND